MNHLVLNLNYNAENNVSGTVHLLQSMVNHGCYNFIFSSSATVYGDGPVPLTEKQSTGHGITNAYGRTKFMIEEILKVILIIIMIM